MLFAAGETERNNETPLEEGREYFISQEEKKMAERKLNKIMVDFSNQVVVFWVGNIDYIRPLKGSFHKAVLIDWIKDKELFMRYNRFMLDFDNNKIDLISPVYWDRNCAYPSRILEVEGEIQDVDFEDDPESFVPYFGYDERYTFDEEEEDRKAFMERITEEQWEYIKGVVDGSIKIGDQ